MNRISRFAWSSRRFSAPQRTIRTELLAGLTTFLTMAYIVFVQPAVLSAAGMDFGAVLVATCLATALATTLMALMANYPIAVAPAMGHNFFFAYSVVVAMHVPWQIALGAVAIAGIVFVLTAGIGLREHLITAIPQSLKYAYRGRDWSAHCDDRARMGRLRGRRTRHAGHAGRSARPSRVARAVWAGADGDSDRSQDSGRVPVGDSGDDGDRVAARRRALSGVRQRAAVDSSDAAPTRHPWRVLAVDDHGRSRLFLPGAL